MIWLYISGLIIPWIFYFLDLLGNNFDGGFSNKTLDFLRVKNDSFLRKVIPLKEGDIIRTGQVRGHRYYLYPRVLALFIQSIITILGLILLFIQLILVSFMPNVILGIIGGLLLGVWVIYTLIMCILSQGLHI